MLKLDSSDTDPLTKSDGGEKSLHNRITAWPLLQIRGSTLTEKVINRPLKLHLHRKDAQNCMVEMFPASWRPLS